MPFESVRFKRQGLRAAAIAAGLLAAVPAFAAGEQPLGVWINDTGRGAIEIKQCGDKLCGHVVWVKDPAEQEGCGLQILGDVTSSGGGVWGDGWIFSPERQKNYNVELKPQSDGTLKVTGYAGVKFLSRTMIWTKAPADLKRCGASEQIDAAAPPPASDPAPAPSTEPGAPATAPSKQAETAPPPPASEPKVANRNRDRDGVDVSGLAEEFGDVFTKKDGKCKVDTPWVKLDFDCGDE